MVMTINQIEYDLDCGCHMSIVLDMHGDAYYIMPCGKSDHCNEAPIGDGVAMASHLESELIVLGVIVEDEIHSLQLGYDNGLVELRCGCVMKSGKALWLCGKMREYIGNHPGCVSRMWRKHVKRFDDRGT